ncbi:Ribose ABC transport system, permease protein [Pseudomonas savastanoi pv. fraxini]|nr:Ribose ABC transport system, permease protein [Pseudomonas savastanoi pv. fraxini]RMR65978.1 Ribose ABC transport system, permease protein [Pseudomonas savastanoi pv. fraxini]RMR70569.1 Ribose ABC transport system, permease protein [Pseudomonas savastanoi pv. fraxini]RMR73200.1 Ribose ABC transport system, permease protein [Pseudomonas savastanoi pv. fraxini]
MELISHWLGSAPDFAVPFALAALGLILIERSGVLALGVEGLMLVGALAGIGMQLSLGSPGLSLLASMVAAGLVSLLFALMVLVLRINQVIAGLALVFFCQGLTGLLGTLLGWTNRPVSGLQAVELWPLSELPVVGRVFVQNPLVYLTVVISSRWSGCSIVRAPGCVCARSARTRRPPMPQAFLCWVTAWRQLSPVLH